MKIAVLSLAAAMPLVAIFPSHLHQPAMASIAGAAAIIAARRVLWHALRCLWHCLTPASRCAVALVACILAGAGLAWHITAVVLGVMIGTGAINRAREAREIREAARRGSDTTYTFGVNLARRIMDQRRAGSPPSDEASVRAARASSD